MANNMWARLHGQPLHCRINGQHYDIVRQSEDWTLPCGGTLQQQCTLPGIHGGHGEWLNTMLQPVSAYNIEEQVDRDPGDLILFWNEPHSA